MEAIFPVSAIGLGIVIFTHLFGLFCPEEFLTPLAGKTTRKNRARLGVVFCTHGILSTFWKPPRLKDSFREPFFPVIQHKTPSQNPSGKSVRTFCKAVLGIREPPRLPETLLEATPPAPYRTLPVPKSRSPPPPRGREEWGERGRDERGKGGGERGNGWGATGGEIWGRRVENTGERRGIRVKEGQQKGERRNEEGGPGSTKCPKQSQKSLRSLKKVYFETPEALLRLFWTLFGPRGRKAPGDSFGDSSGISGPKGLGPVRSMCCHTTPWACSQPHT